VGLVVSGVPVALEAGDFASEFTPKLGDFGCEPALLGGQRVDTLAQTGSLRFDALVQTSSEGIDSGSLSSQRFPNLLLAGHEVSLAFDKIVQRLAQQILEGAAHGAADELANHGRYLGNALGRVKLGVWQGFDNSKRRTGPRRWLILTWSQVAGSIQRGRRKASTILRPIWRRRSKVTRPKTVDQFGRTGKSAPAAFPAGRQLADKRPRYLGALTVVVSDEKSVPQFAVQLDLDDLGFRHDAV